MGYKFFIPILLLLIIIGALLLFLPKETPPTIPSRRECENFIQLPKNFSFLAERGIYIGFTVKYHPNWKIVWEREESELLDVALAPKEVSEENPPIFLVSVRLLTPEMPRTLQNVTQSVISEHCGELLELNYISWKGTPASKIKCVLKDYPGALFSGIQIVKEIQLENVSVPLFYSFWYAASARDFENYLTQVEEMVACLEIILQF